MHTSTDRILTTHVGSLPRSADLTALMHARMEGREYDAAALEVAVAADRRDLVARQIAAGVDVISDGEVSKPSYVTYVTERFDGFAGEAQLGGLADFADYPETATRIGADPGMQHATGRYCVDEVRLRDTDAVTRDIADFRSALEGAEHTEAFLNAASPGAIAMYMPNRHYPSTEAYLYALADAMRHEYRAIVESGLLLQIDCPDLGCAAHLAYADRPHDEVVRAVETHVDVINHATADLPADRIRMHVCWGNYPGTHHRDIELAAIAPAVLRARPQGLLIEAANPRHAHEWAVLADVTIPDDKILIPGVLDTKTDYIEHPELVAQRLENYARLVGPERVIAGTDCGFGTIVGLGWVSPRVVWAKLASMADGARRATDRLRARAG